MTCKNLSKQKCDETSGCTWDGKKCKDSSGYGFLFLLALLLGGGAYLINKYSCKPKLIVKVQTPKSVVFKLWDKIGNKLIDEQIPITKTYELAEGEYTYQATAPGYVPESGTIKLDGCTTATLNISLDI